MAAFAVERITIMRVTIVQISILQINTVPLLKVRFSMKRAFRLRGAIGRAFISCAVRCAERFWRVRPVVFLFGLCIDLFSSLLVSLFVVQFISLLIELLVGQAGIVAGFRLHCGHCFYLEGSRTPKICAHLRTNAVLCIIPCVRLRCNAQNAMPGSVQDDRKTCLSKHSPSMDVCPAYGV